MKTFVGELIFFSLAGCISLSLFMLFSIVIYFTKERDYLAAISMGGLFLVVSLF
jgi:hypothetical protein